MTDVSERIKTVLADLLVLRLDEVRPEHLLVDDLDADSITFLELWFLLERDFGLDLPEVKADEETFNLPLADGFARLEALGGGTTLFEFVRQEVMTRGLPTLPGVDVEMVRAALDPTQRAAIFGFLTIGTLAVMVGGRVPDGFSAHAPIADLRLKDFFRFLTVDALVQYVTFLIGVQRISTTHVAAAHDANG